MNSPGVITIKLTNFSKGDIQMSYFNVKFIIVIELSGVQFGLKSYT